MLQEKENPNKLNIAIKEIKNTKQGNTIIICSSKDDVEILKEAAVKSISDRCIIETTKMRTPTIKIVGYSGTQSSDEIEASLMMHNKWTTTNDSMKISYIRKNEKQDKVILNHLCVLLRYSIIL